DTNNQFSTITQQDTIEINNTKQSSNGVNKVKTSKINSEILENNKVESTTTKSKTQYKITNETYSNYFTSSGKMSSNIEKNAILDISGTLSNKNMIISTPVTITSTDGTGQLIEGTIKIVSAGSGTNVTNIKIKNTIDYQYGIFIENSNNNILSYNNIHCDGSRGYGIIMINGKYNIIMNNNISEDETDIGWTHSPIIIANSHNNTIKNNNIKTNVSNGIYFCTYSIGDYNTESPSTNNSVINNTIHGVDTSWCYGIQVMGYNNYILNNTVIGSYRGISSEYSLDVNDEKGGNIIIGNYLNATSLNIFGGSNSIIKNNIIDGTAVGISVSSKSQVSNNTINTGNSKGITITNSNNSIINNIINTNSGYPIYLYGDIQGNIITSNKINSNTTGIIILKQSSTKKPKNTKIIQNTIIVNSEYTIDAYDSINTTFSLNTLVSSQSIGLDSIRYSSDNSTIINNTQPSKTIELTQANYNTYFDENGNSIIGKINSEDTIKLSTDIKNRNMTFNVPIKLNGNKHVLYNVTITLLEDASGSTISNLTIINSNQKGIILKESNNNKIINNKINANETKSSYGIYLYDSSYNIIQENTITTYGNFVNFGIFLFESNNNKIINNKVNTEESGISQPYATSIMIDETTDIKEIFATYSILLIYSSNNNVTQNKIKLTSKFTKYQQPTEQCMNSMVGIDIYYDSNNNNVENNDIEVNGLNPYSYGFGVLGSVWATNTSANNNKFISNNVTVGGGYFATGFIAGLNSYNTELMNNKIEVTSQITAYGITLEASQNSIIIGNTVNQKSSINFLMELYTSNNNQIINNTLKAKGDTVYGIAGKESSNNNIFKNTIIANNTKTQQTNKIFHNDSIDVGNAGIMFYINSNENIIKENTIISNGNYAINITKSINNKIQDNSLKSNKLYGDDAIYTDKNNSVSGNFLYYIDLVVSDA
ncbi:MAG: right-handed parallel beta-helix repeat-containing protein, partial [Methanobacteriaceae archaeon]|nr:right-handed parallel beta-helix repeat-containing protein [Methanobacteriaceae archaeon]